MISDPKFALVVVIQWASFRALLWRFSRSPGFLEIMKGALQNTERPADENKFQE